MSSKRQRAIEEQLARMLEINPKLHAQLIASTAAVVAVAYADVRISLDPGKVRAALLQDGAYPTEREAELLIMGNADGEVPAELEERFPALVAYLQSHY